MAANKNFDTGGLAGDWAQIGGVQNTETYRAPNVRGEQRSKISKDFIDDQAVLQTDIAGANEDVVTRTTPEAGVYAGAVAASLTTALAGANNDLVFTAKTVGPVGNLINVTYVDPGGVTATLGVVTTGNDIVVNLGRAASAINTTATALAAAIAADPAANALVSVANAGADTGAGLVIAMAKSFLTGGSLGTRVT